ncbi:D-2-hydroxyacid dehydrogenase [Larkinella terrae]|uniref:D-2-hydroxyacid dehydrogenase n=1 Tax=Larkinella terrae TaxID=2025311 RepID=A0A7K0EFL4_9BACT|nr:D-2-hydroxyacid dehydrogenase [Larkinella terrae]MRS60482.1 D-2-hydroxyacid dehydrogenase [Larkinella terrae]
MNLVYADAYTLNPGDLDWTPITSLGSVTLYDRTAPDQLIERLKDADMVLVNKVKMNRQTLEQLPKLRYIGVTATGYDIIDVKAARERDIVVTNVKGYGSASVAQLTISLLLELTNHVGLHADSVRAGDWARNPDFCYWKTPLVELAGKTLGVVGYGDIGKSVAAIGLALGMKILVNRRHTNEQPPEGIRYVDQATLFADSDVISLHCPVTDENRAFVNRTLLNQMKPTAFLINTSRGALINEPDLADALNEGRIAGAGLDVLTVEPPVPNHPLFSARNCLITPHLAWATLESRQRLLHETAENIRAFFSGQPRNVVN